MLGKLVRVTLLLSVVSANHDLPESNYFEVGVFDGDLHESVLDPNLCQDHLRGMSSFLFYDASFRVPQGVLQGNLIHYGNYHQCLAIDQEMNETDHIRGKHCMITVDDLTITLPDIPWGLARDRSSVNMTMVMAVVGELRKYERVKNRIEATELGRTGTLPDATFRLAICIPAACTTQEALGVFLDHRPGLCRLAGDKPRGAADYVAIVVFSLIGLLTIISTAYDVRHTIILQKDPKELSKLYSCASVYTNTRNLFTFSSRPGALTCLDGIRALSILWVIIGHTLINQAIVGYQNIIEMYQWYVSGQAIWIQAADISVDSFFLMSGMLLVYASANKLTDVGLLKNLHLFYLNRLLRMFPILAAAVLLQASFLNRVTDGANWGWQAAQVENCRRYWWSALLHIQNYYNNDYMCLPHTWYLSVDVQLHILSPIVLFWALRGRRSGWVGVVLGFLLSLMASTLYVFLVVSQPDKVYKFHYYENTLTRAPVFLVGMIYGYILHVYRNEKFELSHWQMAIGWLASLVCLGGSLYALHPPLQQGFDSQLYLNMLYSFNRSVWAAGLGWLILACVYGYSGPLNWLLSLTAFKFLARISYAMYVFHYPIQFIWNSAAISTSYFSVANIMWQCTTDVAVTVAVSTLFTVVIDAPFSTLQRILLGTGSQKPVTKGSPVDEEKKLNNGVSHNEDISKLTKMQS